MSASVNVREDGKGSSTGSRQDSHLEKKLPTTKHLGHSNTRKDGKPVDRLHLPLINMRNGCHKCDLIYALKHIRVHAISMGMYVHHMDRLIHTSSHMFA